MKHMTTSECLAICTERLECWKRRLVQENATPVVTLGIRHDVMSGQIVVCMMEDGPLADEKYLAALMRCAAAALEAKDGEYR